MAIGSCGQFLVFPKHHRKSLLEREREMSHSAAPKTGEAAGRDLPSRLGLTWLGTWDPALKKKHEPNPIRS